MIETRANFVFMLIGLMLMWLIAPLISLVSTTVGNIVLYLVIGAALCLGAWSLSRERRFFLVAACITIGAIACSIISYLTGNVLARLMLIGLEIVFWLMCAWFVARHVLAQGPVDINRIAGAICIYIIAGIIWAYLYMLLNYLAPGSFNGLGNIPFEKQLAELLYYSFVTLTTLGYGDMSPAHPLARMLAQIQAVFGQFYIAILIATLVGIRIAHETSGESKDKAR
jgi:hypothetical protein